MLNFQSWKRSQNGYNDYLKIKYAYHYTFTMMLEEVRVLSKLEAKDYESFAERSHFFTQNVVYKVCLDYIEKLKDRNDRDFCLGPTHEEVFTDLLKQEIKMMVL